MSEDHFAAGMRTWREVMGDEYVEGVLSSVTEFNQSFRELVIEFAWGAVWSRPGLDKKSRSLLTLGMLVALNRPAELALHTRAALRNGLTAAEISEALLQSAIYCGVPAALSAFHTCLPILKETREPLPQPAE
jgi:4-carboxymuconolactone decarboxylase